MSRRLRTPEEVCIEYAAAHAEVRRLTTKIGTCTCRRVIAWNEEYATIEDEDFQAFASIGQQPTTCLYDLWHLPQGPEGEVSSHDLAEARSAMCDYCSEAYEYIQTRKRARQRFGAAKRAVGTIGKRLGALTHG